MKKKNLLLILILSSFTVQSQISAITETGNQVILYTDGSWIYTDQFLNEVTEIKTNPYKFTKDKKSTFLIKSDVFNIGFNINPKDWTFEKGGEISDATEYEFSYKHGDLYGMVITEESELSLESLKEIAVENARGAAPDIHIVKEEYRYVNGIKILLLQLDGTIQGTKFTYLGYYFTNENGTLQFLTYSTQKLMKKYNGECEKLLNGLVEL